MFNRTFEEVLRKRLLNAGISGAVCRATALLLAATALTGGWSGLALAQAENADNQGIEEVVVTARRFEENLQRTGGSITALTAAKLEELGVTRANDLQNLVPNLVLKRRGGSASRGLTIKIRGIGTSDVDVPTADPSVGVYIDGIIQARAFGPQFELFDIKRIEVLRGPQGTLYGKNTLGGAINIITHKPTGKGDYRISAGYGNFDAVELRASADVTIVEDKLFASVSGFARNRDGFYTNNLGAINDATGAGQDLGDADVLAARAVIHYVSSSWDFLLTQDISRQRQANFPELFLGFVPGSLSDTAAQLAGFNLNDFVVPVNADFKDRRVITVDTGGLNADALPPGAGGRGDAVSNADFWGTSLIAEWNNGGDYTIKSLTGYRGFNTFISQDLDGTPVSIADQVTGDSGWQFTQELQVRGLLFKERLNVITGLFWLHEELLTEHTNPFFLGFLPQISALRVTTTNTDSFAGYVHGVFSVTDKLKFSAGLRYNHENKAATLRDGDLVSIVVGVPFRDQPNSIFDQPPLGTGDLNARKAESFNSVQPKFGIDYTFNDNLFLYFIAARGFASGGFNGRVNRNLNGIETFGQETLWNYEVGFKSDFFDHRARLNVSTFWLAYSNIVVQSFGGGQSGTEIGFFLQNSGAARVRGFEVEFAVRPIPAFLFRANLGYLDQKFKEFGVGSDGQPIDPSLANFFDSPNTTISLIGQYDQQLPNGAGTLILSVDWSYRTRTFFDNDGVVGSSQPNYDLTNIRLTYASPDDRYQLNFWAKNIFQETYLRRSLQVLDTPLGFASGLFGDPRTYGFTLTIRR